MSTSRRRSAGLTLLEVVIAVAVFAVVLALFLSSFMEATDAGKTLTTDIELRSKGQDLLARIAQDLRSSQTASGNVTILTTPNPGIAFSPVTGFVTTPLGPVFSNGLTTQTIYQWVANPTASTPGYPKPTILLTPFDQPTRQYAVCSEVTGFSVVALGTTAVSGFSGQTPQTFIITVQLSRNAGTAANKNGQMTIQLTTQVTVPPG